MEHVSPQERVSQAIAKSLALPLSLLIWWIAVIDKSGQIQYMEYTKLMSCQTMQRTLSRVSKVTTCTWREEHGLDRLSS